MTAKPFVLYPCACGRTLVRMPGQLIDCCRQHGVTGDVLVDRLDRAMMTMDRALAASRLELPAAVHDDLTTKWTDVLVSFIAVAPRIRINDDE